MRGFVLCAWIAAGCGNEGVYLEVRAPDGMPVQRVELYLADRGCDDTSLDCSSITPPAFDDEEVREKIEGEVYFVDNAETIFESTVDGAGSAWFYLPPQRGVIKTAIAVADGGTAIALLGGDKIELASTDVHLRLDLRPTQATSMTGLDPAIELWEGLTLARRCVGVQLDGRKVFIVPEDDPDCDEVAAPECAPTVHKAQSPVSSALVDQDCAILDPDHSPACHLGSRACNERLDGPSQVSVCTRSEAISYCVPDAVCECTDLKQGCLDTLLQNPDTPNELATRIECEIPLIADSGTGGFTACSNAVQFDPAQLSTGGDCGFAEVALLGFSGFQPAMILTDPAGNTPIRPIAMAPVGTGCQVTLQSFAADYSAFPTEQTKHLALKIDALPSVRGTKLVLIPLDIKFTKPDECAMSPPRCAFKRDNTEQLEKCFQ